MAALTDRPAQWDIEDLLADLWVLIVRVNSEKGSLADDFDHPVRVAMMAKAKAAHKAALKEEFRRRKNAYTSS
ncbi:hypothetical protein [Mycolicibacter minnesotensis]